MTINRETARALFGDTPAPDANAAPMSPAMPTFGAEPPPPTPNTATARTETYRAAPLSARPAAPSTDEEDNAFTPVPVYAARKRSSGRAPLYAAGAVGLALVVAGGVGAVMMAGNADQGVPVATVDAPPTAVPTPMPEPVVTPPVDTTPTAPTVLADAPTSAAPAPTRRVAAAPARTSRPPAARSAGDEGSDASAVIPPAPTLGAPAAVNLQPVPAPVPTPPVVAPEPAPTAPPAPDPAPQ